LIIHSEIIPDLFFPTIIEEFVAQLRADSILIPAGNSWRLDAGRWLCWQTTFTLPETTHDLISWALRNLSAEARHLLDVLAVAGQGRALLHLHPGLPAGRQRKLALPKQWSKPQTWTSRLK